MSVVNGQIANQTTFNNAFMSRTAPTTNTTAIVSLENTETESGASIGNTQKAINKAFEGVGATGESDVDINNYSSNNYIADGDNRKQAIEKIDVQLKQTQDDLDAAELTIADHENRIDSAELTIANHESRLDSAELTITDHENRIDSAELTITDHESRLDTIETGNNTFSGNKTFNNNVTIVGNLEVQGTTTTIQSTDLQIQDQNILVNKNGTDGSAEGAGITVERPSGNAGVIFDSTLASKFKIGFLSSLYEVVVSGVAQSIAGIKNFTSGIKTDLIDESTLNAGVTIDGVLIKDGNVDGRDVSADGLTLDSHTTTLSDHESRLDSAELTIANHESRLDSAELTIADHESRLDSAELTIADHESRLDTIETGNNTFGGTKTFSGDVNLNGNTIAKNIKLSENLFVGAVANVQTGSNVQLTGINAPLVKLTGSGLVSIDRIEAPADDKIIALLNLTGADVTILDNVGTPSSQRIRTGLGADIILKNNGIAFLAYDTTAALWFVSSVAQAAAVGGGGGGSKTLDMKLNGLYGGSAAYNGVDAAWIAPANINITNVFIYQDTPGSGGTTNLDLKVKPFLSGAFTSIFLTTPKVTNLGGANSWCGVGDTVTGFTAPVLTSLPFAVAAKSCLRMDLLQAQTGSAAGVGLIIVYENV